MVADAGAADGAGRPALTAGRLRPLNQPRLIQDETDDQGVPLVVWLSGQRCAVESLLEAWRIDDEWWREQPVSRAYWRLLLEDGRTLDVYHDLPRDSWFRQAYSA